MLTLFVHNIDGILILFCVCHLLVTPFFNPKGFGVVRMDPINRMSRYLLSGRLQSLRRCENANCVPLSD